MPGSIRTDFDVPATMRDGVILRANIFRPADDGQYPVLIARTPYGKDFMSVSPYLDAVRMARAGYIVVLQDVRGRFGSDGEWVNSVYEAPDGHDTVEWAACLPGSTGQVGMFGASYLGFTVWAAATQAPPSLKAIMPSITWADSRDGRSWVGGASEFGRAGNWQLSMALNILMRRHAKDPAKRGQAIMQLVREIDRLRPDGYLSLPLKEFAPFKTLDIAPDFFESVAKPNDREAARVTSILPFYDRIRVPSFNVGGWYDIFTQGTLQNFSDLRRLGATPEARQTKLLMGPWSHVNNTNTVGEVDFGFAAQMAFIDLRSDLTGLAQRWFDHWLKGIDTGIMREPPVKLFIMGANTWREEQEWPLARTQYTPYYLHSGGRANTLNGDGALSTDAPGAEPADRYTFDPANPVPTHGGALLMSSLYGPGARDQRPIESRVDVLVFSTPPLERDVEVTGPVVLKLWAATDARDTDFVARLVDVHPDGFAQNLCDGILRARFRDPDAPALLEPGRAYELTISLWSTANLFKRGHRIRLDVTSSNFPRWDRNPNTGAAFGDDAVQQAARQTILHDTEHPSRLILPVIPG